MEYLSKSEKLEIVLNIVKKLRAFEGPHGAVNLYNDEYSFVPEIKKVFKEYLDSDKPVKGTLEFKEIGKLIEYRLPITNTKKPLFVIRM